MHRKTKKSKTNKEKSEGKIEVRYDLLLLKCKRKTQVHLSDSVRSVYTRYGLSCGVLSSTSCKDTWGEEGEKQIFQVIREALDVDSDYSLARISFIISY